MQIMLVLGPKCINRSYLGLLGAPGMIALGVGP